MCILAPVCLAITASFLIAISSHIGGRASKWAKGSSLPLAFTFSVKYFTRLHSSAWNASTVSSLEAISIAL